MSAAPAALDLHLAAEWCEEYDGDGDDAEQVMKRVGAWLHEQAYKVAEAEQIAEIRRGVKVKTGHDVTVAQVRTTLKDIRSKTQEETS